MDGLSLAARLEQVQFRIREAAQKSGRDARAVDLVAVSKTQSAEQIRAAASLGVTQFGENYVQEALAKWSELASLNLQWHFIGALQSNKAKQVVGKVALIHSVDRMSLAEELSRRAANQTQGVLIEVNLANEMTKSGVTISDLPKLIDGVSGLGGLALRGLMAMPPLAEKPEDSRKYFAQARELFTKLQPKGDSGLQWTVLSMGTTSDYAVAIEEGATLVRVGTAIFGERKK